MLYLLCYSVCFYFQSNIGKRKIKVSTDVELPNTVKYVLLYFAPSSENLKMTHILFAMKYYGGPSWNCVTQHKIIKMLAFLLTYLGNYSVYIFIFF